MNGRKRQGREMEMNDMIRRKKTNREVLRGKQNVRTGARKGREEAALTSTKCTR